MPTIVEMSAFTRHVRQSLQGRGYDVGVTAKQQMDGQNPTIQLHFPDRDIEVPVPKSLDLGELEDQVLSTLGIGYLRSKTALERILEKDLV